MACGAMAQSDKPQIPNGDFESWTKYSSSNNAPDYWNSFQTAEGGFASMAKAQQIDKSTNVRPGSTGQTSCVIWCRAVMGIPAQGNMTTGCINAGSMSAANIANYNFDKVSDETKSMKFTGRPDSIVFWTRFVPKKVIADAPTAKFSAIIHDNYEYIAYGLDSNDTEVNKSHVVAKAVHQIESKDGVWQRISIPFEYTENAVNAEYIMLNFSTNAIPGKGTAGDSLYVDDIEVIYNEPAPEGKTFTEDLYVVVNGLINGPQSTSFQVSMPAEDKINFSLKNFMLNDGETSMPIGNIEVNDITVEDGEFEFQGDIQITDGDVEGVEFWMGPMLGNVPLNLRGEAVSEDLLKVYIAITMEDLGQDIEVFLGYTEEEVHRAVGIEGIAADGAKAAKTINNGAMYNLSGQRILTPAKNSIYIMNGKKYIAK